MSQEITKELMCIRLKSGIEIWASADRIKPLEKVLLSGGSSLFFDYEGETINTSEVAGIFRASTMEEMTRRKNGQWRCKSGLWHERSDKCQCPPPNVAEKNRLKQEAIRNCGKCKGGYVDMGTTVMVCECVARFD